MAHMCDREGCELVANPYGIHGTPSGHEPLGTPSVLIEGDPRAILDYLDQRIRQWTEAREAAAEGGWPNLAGMDACKVDAYQEVRLRLFGEELDVDGA